LNNSISKRYKVAIIILNYKNWQDTIECLESLQSMDYSDYLMIVVDNGSFNGSVEKIKSWANGEIEVKSEYIRYNPDKKPVHIIEYERNEAENGGIPEKEFEINNIPSDRKLVIIKNNENLGYSAGNNVGIRYAVKRSCDYTIILNNDTIIIDKTFIKKLLDPFKYDEKIFVIGPKILTPSGDYDGPYIYESFWGEFIGLTIRNQFHKLLKRKPVYIDINAILASKPVPVYKISGACMVFRSSFLKEIGYLDENVWLSCEEAIIAEKVLKRGGKIYFQPLTQIVHKKAQSPRSDKSKIGILKNHFKQRQYFLKTYRDYGLFKISIIKLMHKLRLLFESVKVKI